MATRIASLLPSVTEIVCALGLGDRLVARSHECDFPPGVESVPAITASRLPAGAVTQAEIDAAVTEAVHSGAALYWLDAELLARQAPDLVVTQSLCDVCAVDEGLALAAVSALDPPARMLSLSPARLDEVIGSVGEVAAAAGEPTAGAELMASLRGRVEAVRSSMQGRSRVRVAALEWLDPPWSAGHWVPEQIAAAGGEDVLAEAGERSARVTWDDVRWAAPDVVMVMPCGLPLAEALALLGDIPDIPGRIVAVDASGLFSRPGPRLVDGVEVLARVLHPRPGDPPPGDAWAWADGQAG